MLSSVASLCKPMERSPPASFLHGVSPERILGLPLPPPGDLPDPGNLGIKPVSPASPALAGGFFITEPPGKSNIKY